MNNDKDLQFQIDELKKRLDNFNASQTIPLSVDKSWQARGFIKTDFFVAGTGTIASGGNYELTIPGSTKHSLVLVTPYESTNNIGAQMIQALSSNTFGDSTTQFDITRPGVPNADTTRYTFDGTGTNPNISATTIPVGTRIVIFIGGNSGNSNSASKPFFIVTASGANYFEITNSDGVAENNITIGAGGSITGGLTNTYAMYVSGTSGDVFSFVVFLFNEQYTDRL